MDLVRNWYIQCKNKGVLFSLGINHEVKQHPQSIELPLRQYNIMHILFIISLYSDVVQKVLAFFAHKQFYFWPIIHVKKLIKILQGTCIGRHQSDLKWKKKHWQKMHSRRARCEFFSFLFSFLFFKIEFLVFHSYWRFEQRWIDIMCK